MAPPAGCSLASPFDEPREKFMFPHLSLAMLVALMAAAGGAAAQAAAPDRADRAPSEALHLPATASEPWRSALHGYQPFADEKLAPWRESNDTVGRIGGWKAYAREASQPDEAPSAPSTGTGAAAYDSPPARGAHPQQHRHP
jgi:hypothetical protein